MQKTDREALLARITELEEQNRILKSRKKYGLVWEEEKEPEEVVQRCTEEIPTLTEVREQAIEQDDSPGHLLIEGDNFHALSLLSYTHKKKVDVLYLDPPYNTGNKDFTYNDKYVDPEDAYRHSKWLSFMNARLKLAKELLKDDGVIFISIDDNEMAALKMLCDDIFGERNFVSTLIWNTKSASKGVPPLKMVTDIHEYVLVYQKNDGFAFNGIKRTTDDFGNPDNDPRGLWRKEALVSTISKKSFEIIDPKTGNKFFRAWAFSPETIQKMISEERVIFPKKPSGTPLQKKFFNDYTNANVPINTQIGTFQSRGATSDLMRLFDGNKVFDFPKPVDLIRFLLEQSTTKDSVIIDFMAGSGTTGHAVLQLNAEDGGKRQCILCTNNEKNGIGSKLAEQHPKEDPESFGICRRVTYPRLQKVMQGYTTPKGEKKEGLGGNLRYFRIETDQDGHCHPLPRTDADRRAFAEKCREVLCIKENSFQEIMHQEGAFALYEGKEKITGMLFDELHLEDFKKALRGHKKPLSLYVFSYGSEVDGEDFADVSGVEEIHPLPLPLLKEYQKVQAIALKKHCS